MPETTPLIKAALNLRGGAGFDVYFFTDIQKWVNKHMIKLSERNSLDFRTIFLLIK